MILSVPKDGEVYFVATNSIEKFAKEYLPKMNTTFILLSHLSAKSVPTGNMKLPLSGTA